MKHIVFSFIVIMLTSCKVANTVYDYDEQQDFLIYKTYNFSPELHSGLSDLDHKRLIAATEVAMQNKGFVKSEHPDVYVNFKTVFSETPSRNRVGIGVGGGSRGMSIGVGSSIPIGGPELTLELTLDLIDVKKNELVWQAVTERRFRLNASPDKRTDFFQETIEKVFVKYPPEK